MQSRGLLANLFVLVLDMILVSSTFGVVQHVQAHACAIKSSSTTEAIVNGGFESGDLTGWTVGFGNGSAAVATTNPYSGGYCACITGLNVLYQGFQGIPTSSIQSITYCARTEPESSTLFLELLYSDGWDYIEEPVTSSWTFFDVTSNLKTDKVLLRIQLPGWARDGTPMNTYYDDVSILYSPPPTYNVTIDAHCNTEGTVVNVGIAKDGSSTGLSTPHTFYGLDGSHTFTVPSADVLGHPFSQWNTGQTSTTISISDAGTYTAYYNALAPFGNATRVPEDYKSVQAAIDAAAPGSTIIIAPGIYNESLVINKTLTIVGKLGSEPIFVGGGSGIAITLLSGASGSIVTGITITSWDQGILINNASGCKIYNNIMSLISNNGIVLQGANAVNNQIYSNIFQQDAVAVDLTSSAYNSTVSQNIISLSTTGLRIETSGNIICANILSQNQIGINVTNSNNKIFHNTFVDNTVQVSVSMSTANVWDDGYPSGGNCWSDHAGPDLYSGPSQDQPGSDGIVDTSYTIATGSVDRYPLTHGQRDIGITSVSTSKTVVGKGYTLRIESKILNYGTYDESFPVVAYANTSSAVTQNITLTKETYTIVALTWNTSSFAYGNYTMSVYSEPVQGETKTEDNMYVYGWVTIAIPGDIKGDGVVDIYDAILLSGTYNAKPGNSNWNPNADINSDSIVDIYDAIILAGNYGKTA